MATKELNLNSFRNHPVNRVTSNSAISDFIEQSLYSENETMQHTFHKITVTNTNGCIKSLCDTMTDYYSTGVIPVHADNTNNVISFYTTNLSLILKIIKFDFILPHQRAMAKIEIIFNDKTSLELFELKVSVEDIMSSIVSQRYNRNTLDLSNFCDDLEFKDKKIFFYSFSLLCHFKKLMLRMGSITKSLNLSYNKLTQPPLEVLNFFIKGDLTEINLSYNDIQSASDLSRVSSKIEKLWIEGNPLCEKCGLTYYIRHITSKFPRLSELDGIKLHENNMPFSAHIFFKNFLVTTEKNTSMVIEKFLTLYFTHYDSPNRKVLQPFYSDKATLSITCKFFDVEENQMAYMWHSRNFLTAKNHTLLVTKQYEGSSNIVETLSSFPSTIHDPNTFSVDVLEHNENRLIVVVDGVYKHKNKSKSAEQILAFRRTFVMSIQTIDNNYEYRIVNEMFYLSDPSKLIFDSSFKKPIRNLNCLALFNPVREETDAMIRGFTHITQLKRDEAKLRLSRHRWDIKETLNEFMIDLKNNDVPSRAFMEEEDFSDTSSTIDEELD